MEIKEGVITEQERELFAKAQAGDDKAFATLYTKHKALAYYLSNRLSHLRLKSIPDYEYEDAISDTLMKCILTYKPETGNKFSALLSTSLYRSFRRVNSAKNNHDISYDISPVDPEDDIDVDLADLLSFDEYEDDKHIADTELICEKLVRCLPQDLIEMLITTQNSGMSMRAYCHSHGKNVVATNFKLNKMQRRVKYFFDNMNLIYKLTAIQGNSINTVSQISGFSRTCCEQLLNAYEYFYKCGDAPTRFLNMCFSNGTNEFKSCLFPSKYHLENQAFHATINKDIEISH